jgi:quinol monooxygenase YgiN
MPTLPWTVPNPPQGETALVMASRFEVRSLKDVPRFFLKSLSAWRQVRSAPGCFGASLVARPFARTFLTLSAWDDRASLMAYNATDPHKSIVTAMRPTMKTSVFVFWNTGTADLPITWPEAERRIAEKSAEGTA